MQRQRDGLVPIGEALADLGAPAQALRETPPPARRGFTLADQVNQLVSASEADPDRGFMARLMALCSLPRTNPGNRIRYKRVNGPYTLYMTAGAAAFKPASVTRCGGSSTLMSSWCTKTSAAKQA